jgi:hypothetical protein
MKMTSMLRYFIYSLICYLSLCMNLHAQEEDTQTPDSLVVKQKYGLRVGVDASKLARTFLETDYSGFELNADYRIAYKLYVAADLGIEERTSSTDYLNSTANGSYLKVGVDYNMYTNWAGMENMVYSGLRFGLSNFNQTLNSYTIYDTNNPTWGQTEVLEGKEFTGLSAAWLELVFGFKAEVFNNLFVGLNIQIKGRLSETQTDNFENIYIPGFGRTFDSGNFGVGFGYNISYLIPLLKKAKK